MTPLDAVAASPWWWQLILVVIGTARVVRLLYADRLTDAARLWLWARRPPESSYIGYLATCPWCLGVWVGTAATAAWFNWPRPTLAAACVSCVAGVAAWLCELTDEDH